MSIIYDALQKTQRSLGNKHTNSQTNAISKKWRWLDAGLVGIIILLLIATILAYYPKVKNWIQSTKNSNPQNVIPVQKTLPSNLTGKIHNVLILKGVFLSDQEKFALINNQSLRVGDSIGGKKVISIDFDKVKLQDENGIITLASTAS